MERRVETELSAFEPIISTFHDLHFMFMLGPRPFLELISLSVS